jgi:hypothetical protein
MSRAEAADLSSRGALAQQQPRQPGDVDGDAARLIPGQPLVHGATRQLIVEIDVREFLPGIGDDEAFAELLDRPGRREAAGRHCAA